MDPTRWERMREIFVAATACPTDKQREAIDRLCAGDDALRDEVLQLLQADRLGDRIDRHPGELLGLSTPPFVGSLPRPFGRYTLLDVLGHGSFSTVYRASQEHPQREVALKVLQGVEASPRRRERFLREGELLARLDHPGIARVYECHPGGREMPPSIAIELVNGVPITTYVFSRQLQALAVVAIMLKVCDAVAHAHQRAVIHRDLKPANILLVPDGTPKVLDFGIAQLVETDGLAATATANQVLGTVAYMSPEQASMGELSVDTRTDVYSLGVIFFELLTGRPPIVVEGLSLPAAMGAVRTQTPVPLGRFRPDLNRDFEAIAAKALAPRAVDRYGSVADFAIDLGNLVASRPIVARRPSLGRTAFLLARRRPGVVVATTIALAGIGVALGVINSERQRSERAYGTMVEMTLNMLASIQNNLAPQVGTAESRRKFLDGLRPSVEGLVLQVPEDWRALLALARWHGASANLYVQEEEFDAAAVDRERALVLMERVVRKRPLDSDVLAEYAISAVHVGDVHKSRERLEDAQRQYEAAMKIDERLVELDPTSPRFANNLCWSHERLAELALRSGDTVRAVSLAERRLFLARSIAERWPSNDASYNLWMGHAFLAHVYRNVDRNDDFAKECAAATPIADTLCKQDPGNRDYLRFRLLLAVSKVNVARNQRDCAARERLRDELIPLAERATVLEHQDFQLAEAVTSAWSTVALLCTECGDHRAALDAVKTAVALARERGLFESQSMASRFHVIRLLMDSAHIAERADDARSAADFWTDAAAKSREFAFECKSATAIRLEIARMFCEDFPVSLRDADFADAEARDCMSNTVRPRELVLAWVLRAKAAAIRGDRPGTEAALTQAHELATKRAEAQSVMIPTLAQLFP